MLFKKFTSIVVVVILVASALTACVNNQQPEVTDPVSSEPNFNKTGFPIVNEKITVTIASPRRYDINRFSELPFWQMIEDKTNVHIEWNDIDRDTGWAEKKSLMIASQDLPDLFYGSNILSDAEVLGLINQKMLVPIDNYIDEYSIYLKNFFNDFPELKNSVTAPDGRIYTFPSYTDSSETEGVNQRHFYMNTKWLSDLNLAMPATTDDLYNTLKLFKENDMNGNGSNSDEMPLTFRTLYGNESFSVLFGAFSKYSLREDMIFPDSGEIVFVPTSDGFKEFIIYANRLFSEKLADVEGFTMDRPTYTAKIAQDPSIVGSFFAFKESHPFGGQEHPDYDTVPPLKGPNGLQYAARGAGYSFRKTSIVITNECKYPEEMFRWADLMYEPEIGWQAEYGLIAKGDQEGFNYTYRETADGKLIRLDPPEGYTRGEWLGKIAPGTSCNHIVLKEIKDKVDTAEDSLTVRDRALYKPYLQPETNFNFELVFMDTDTTDRIADLRTDLLNYVNKMLAEWLVRGGIEEEWDGYVRTLNNMNLEEFMQIQNDLYKSYINK